MSAVFRVRDVLVAAIWIVVAVCILIVDVRAMILVPAPVQSSEALAYNRVDHSDYPIVDRKGNKNMLSLEVMELGVIASAVTGSAFQPFAVHFRTPHSAFSVASDSTRSYIDGDYLSLKTLITQLLMKDEMTSPVQEMTQKILSEITILRRRGKGVKRQLGRWVDTPLTTSAALATPTDRRLSSPPPPIMQVPVSQLLDTLHDETGKLREKITTIDTNALGALRSVASATIGATKALHAAADRVVKARAVASTPPPTAAAPLKSVPVAEGAVQTVWYGTNRAPNEEDNYSGEMDDTGPSGPMDVNGVHYGQIQVLVPTSHVKGSTGSSWAWRQWTGEDDRLRVTFFNELEESEFWNRLKQSVANEKPDSALIFLHGYCNSFRDAAIRTAQIAFDLEFPGIAAFYSWPSKGETTAYPLDERAVAASIPEIAHFLTQLVVQSGIKRVHIIAHSMGNRALLGALNHIRRLVDETRQPALKGVLFDQLVLAAPDLGEAEFNKLQAAYSRLGSRSTIYASPNDRALQVSSAIHQDRRIGLLAVHRPGFDMIDVGSVDLSMIGHSYVADAVPVLNDLRRVLQRAKPDERESVVNRGTGVWELVNDSIIVGSDRSEGATPTTPPPSPKAPVHDHSRHADEL